jgi:hypothetical protein
MLHDILDLNVSTMFRGTARCGRAMRSDPFVHANRSPHILRVAQYRYAPVLAHLRNTAGIVRRSPLCVPIHENQYHKKALVYFPLPGQHLVVLEAEDEAEDAFGEDGEEANWDEGGERAGQSSSEEPAGKKLKLTR